MYQIKYDSSILYDPRDDELSLRDVDIHLAAGEPGSLSFTIDNDHPAAGQLAKLLGTLELSQEGNTLYRGRIIRDENDFYNSRRVETEGLLAALNDSIVEPFSFPDDFKQNTEYQAAAASGNVVTFLLGWLLDQHNAQVTADREIKLGVVTVADDNNYIVRESTDYITTWDAVRNKLADSTLGGYLLPRYEADGIYLDYLEDFTLTNTQPVEFGENLLDLVSEMDATEVYTAILPIGAEGLTIKDLTDGEISPGIVKEGKIIYSVEGRAQYGNITRTVKWDDVTLASNLQNKAVAELTGAGVLMTNSITVKACDLHCDDDQIASFQVGRYVTITSAPHDFSQSFALVELEPDIMDPGNTTITLGSKVQTQTDRNRAAQAAASQQLEKQTIDTGMIIDEVVATTSQQITEAVQTAQGLIFSALDNYVQTGDFTTYQETVSSTLEILSESINLNIQQVSSTLSQVGDDLQQQITDITKYFRFTADGLLIGETGNEVLLRLDNDVIQFLRSNIPGLWMDEDGLHADSVGTGRIQIGNAEITDEAGRLTLRKAVNN